MNIRIPALFLLLPAAMAAAQPPAPDAITVAVFDFSVSKGSMPQDLGSQVSAVLEARLSSEPQLVVVERADLKKILSEHELNLSGDVSPENAVKIGQLTGAKVLVTGRAFMVDQNRVLVAKVMGTETGRVYGELVNGSPSTSIVDLASDLEKKIVADLTARGETLTATVEPPEARLARLKQALAGKSLPVVSVSIGERSMTQSGHIDPAAETELGLVLQRCGFTVVDENSSRKPDIEITGEAFSSFGMRLGQLYSCNARVEITARDVATGNIRVIDRQTSAAVGIDDPTTEKLALQNAAMAIAERLLPKLAN